MSVPAYLVLPEGEAFIALGANLGDARATIAAAIAALAELPDTRVIATSALVVTAPVGPPQPDYTNGAVRVASGLGPHALLDELLRIERSLGRIRPDATRWGPRTIDLDLIAYGTTELDDERLTLPHPRAHERLFVLRPLADLIALASPEGGALRRRIEELGG